MTKTIICPACDGAGWTGTHTCERCHGTGNVKRPMTNGDRIRAMGDEELGDFLYSYKFCDMCKEGCAECCYHGDCERRLADWLRQIVEEE